MKPCIHEATLQAWIDGELSPDASAEVRSHLATCVACAQHVRAARQTLALVDDVWRVDLPPVIPAARLRARVAEGLAAPPAPAVVWRWQIAAAAIVVLAIALIGVVATRLHPKEVARLVDPPTPAQQVRSHLTPEPDAGISGIAGRKENSAVRVPPTSRNSRNSRRRATRLESETSKHLGQTQLLLRSVRNAEAETGLDLAYERELSRELLNRNRLLRRRAEQKEDRRAEELLSHIEPLLLDIAHLPEQAAPHEMRSLKELISAQQIIAELQLYAGRNLF